MGREPTEFLEKHAPEKTEKFITVMQNPPTNTLILPPETDQPPGLSLKEEENSNRSNKKVKNSHIIEISFTDDSTPAEILDESMETLISGGRPSEVPQGKELKMNDRTPFVELNHGIAEFDCTKMGGGGDDPQPNRYKSYKDVVSNENQKDFVFNKDDDWSDEEDSMGLQNSQNLDLNVNPSKEDSPFPIVDIPNGMLSSSMINGEIASLSSCWART